MLISFICCNCCCCSMFFLSSSSSLTLFAFSFSNCSFASCFASLNASLFASCLYSLIVSLFCVLNRAFSCFKSSFSFLIFSRSVFASFFKRSLSLSLNPRLTLFSIKSFAFSNSSYASASFSKSSSSFLFLSILISALSIFSASSMIFFTFS